MRVDPLAFIALLWLLSAPMAALARPRRSRRPRAVPVTFRIGRAPGIPRAVA